jgi:hypothetical protein
MLRCIEEDYAVLIEQLGIANKDLESDSADVCFESLADM